MRLIDTQTLELVDFSTKPLPNYAILSHTWGTEEVSFLNLRTDLEREGTGWRKVLRVCALAREQGINYAWVDTCCIDKGSSAELSEAINSMFLWYKHATVCYAYLEDLDFAYTDDIYQQLKQCKWWSRGWTLQELIAPLHIEFYDMSWTKVGTKVELAAAVSRISRVPRNILLDLNNLTTTSIAVRMSWAADRVTSRPEDEAYSLMGIFGVNMPLIYGEGKRAFRRLQEEIIKRRNDLTIFASNDTTDLLADSPRGFRDVGYITDFAQSTDFAITNKGLKFSGDMALFGSDCLDPEEKALNTTIGLFLGKAGNKDSVMLWLRKVQPRVYRCHPGKKIERIPYATTAKIKLRGRPITDFYIIVDWNPVFEKLSQLSREDSMHIPACLGNCVIVPQMLWDPEDRMILKPSRQELVLAVAVDVDVQLDGGPNVNLVTLCRREPDGSLHVFLVKGDERDRIRNLMFEHDDRGLPLSWRQLMLHAPLVENLSDKTCVTEGDAIWEIHAFLEYEVKNPKRSKMCFSQRILPSWSATSHLRPPDNDRSRSQSF